MKRLVLAAVLTTGIVGAAAAQMTGAMIIPPNETPADRESVVVYIGSFLEGYRVGRNHFVVAASQAGVLDQVLDRLVLSRTSCMPDAVTAFQATLVVRKWLQDNPARLHESASVLIPEAFAAAWPCKR